MTENCAEIVTTTATRRHRRTTTSTVGIPAPYVAYNAYAVLYTGSTSARCSPPCLESALHRRSDLAPRFSSLPLAAGLIIQAALRAIPQPLIYMNGCGYYYHLQGEGSVSLQGTITV